MSYVLNKISFTMVVENDGAVNFAKYTVLQRFIHSLSFLGLKLLRFLTNLDWVLQASSVHFFPCTVLNNKGKLHLYIEIIMFFF